MKQEKDIIAIELIELPYVHHGGAWKVAYADFMTAMMAFFLLMWLLNMAPQETKEQLADYFDPGMPLASNSLSGAGGVLGGLTMSPEGARASDKSPITPMQQSNDRKRGGEYKSKVNQVAKSSEHKRFEETAKKIKRAVQTNKELAKLKDNIDISITPEGLRIELVDKENESMFPSGSATMFQRTRDLLAHITDVIIGMPNDLSIRGHTDGMRYSEEAIYTNWELSADRANAVRRAMLSSGFPKTRVDNVIGKADTKLLIEDNPLDARNRRITLILLNQNLPFGSESEGEQDGEELLDGSEDLDYGEEYLPLNPYEKRPGAVEFP